MGLPPDATAGDWLALAWFGLAWLGYAAIMQALPWQDSINHRLDDVRRAWMVSMLQRDNRITDSSLIGHTVHSATFFASTTMVALAALLGVLGGFDHSYAALGGLGFTAKTSRDLAEVKLLLLVLVFAHTFLKLSWSLRQLNYCLALIGAAPLRPDPGDQDRIAEPVAAVLTLAIRSFNAGIRGYYFALAALAWLLGPAAFAAATGGIVAMLVWRQYGSPTSAAIKAGHAAVAQPRGEGLETPCLPAERTPVPAG